MNYTEHYNKLIERAKNRLLECYTERHHIVPKCMGGSDEVENLVRLTAEEHYVAHQLLVKIYPGHRGLAKGAYMMTWDRHGNRVNNKAYGWLKRKYSEAHKGIPRTEEQNQHHSKVMKGKTPWNKGKTGVQVAWNKGKTGGRCLDEIKRKISATKMGEIKSIETRKRMSEGKLGKKLKIVSCPTCNKEGGLALMKRWHFNNCKRAIA